MNPGIIASSFLRVKGVIATSTLDLGRRVKSQGQKMPGASAARCSLCGLGLLVSWGSKQSSADCFLVPPVLCSLLVSSSACPGLPVKILSQVDPLIPVGRGTGGSPESVCVECGLQDHACWRGQSSSSSTEQRPGLRNFSHTLLLPQVTELEVLIAAVTPEPSVAAGEW